MSKKLIIYGAGNIAREIMYAAMENKSEVFETIAFVVDEEFNKNGGKVEGVDVISLSDISRKLNSEMFFIIGIGNPIYRKEMCERLSSLIPFVKYATIIHKSVVIMPKVIIEEGTYIAAHTTVATGAHLKRHTVINQNCSVGHDTVIDEYSVVSPGCILSGRTVIGCVSFLGSNVVTYPKIRIGNYCSVSALTVVARNLRERHNLVLRQTAMVLPTT